MAIFLLITFFSILAVCVHEYAHARVAYAGGDTSVVDKGYLSMNPLKYVHPVYSIVMPLVFVLIGGIFLPGGAVYIEHWRLRSKGWDSAVSAAGPIATFLLAIVFSVAIRCVEPGGTLAQAFAALALLQITGALFNLLPIPPLDGYGIISPYLRTETQLAMNRMSQYTLWGVVFAMWYVPPVSAAFFALVDVVAGMLQVPHELAYRGLRSLRVF